MMNKEKFYTQEKLGSYVIDKQDDIITIIAKGNESPFEYFSKIVQDITKLAKNKDYNVFIDTLLYLGDTDKHVLKAQFISADKRLDIDRSVRMPLCDTPKHVQSTLASFYNANTNLLKTNSLFPKTRSQKVLNYINSITQTPSTVCKHRTHQ